VYLGGFGRTTGAAGSRLGRRRGISSLEYIGMDPRCVVFMLKGLRKHGVIYEESSQAIR
jgi:hypothetical protein